MIALVDPIASLLDLPRWVFEVGFFAYAILVTLLVVLERRRPTTTLALVLALVFLPIVGLIVYLLFTRRVRKRIRRRKRRPINPVDDTEDVANLEQLPANLATSARGLVTLALKTAAAPLRRGESVVLLPTASSAFTAFSEAIASATRTIHCEFYIWRDDPTARRITHMLTERAQAGVTVRVLYDHLGSLGLPNSHFEALRAAGGHVAIFGRLRLPMRVGGLRFNFRNHRKIMTVDGRRGFLGGLNIGDEYLDPSRDDRRWRDLAVDVSGDAVVGLEAIFLEDWLATTGDVIGLEGKRSALGKRIDPRRPLPRDRPWRRARHQAARAKVDEANPFAPRLDRPVASTGPLLQIIPSGPDRPLVSVISAQFSAAIASANRRAWLATPYFVPDEPLMLILRTAALRGIDLRLLVPSPEHIDSRITSWAGSSYYDALLASGARIFEYQRGMLHSKFLIVDDICAIGSANMDVRSFHINYEVTGMFYDADITAALAEIFAEDLERSKPVTETSRMNLPWRTRVAESAARVLSPLL
ncbi:MAG: PLDc N-terminal domain-containing protein [Deltaproteobacteria bacterium]|nr:PLDc N-terminal domain-containing protein [Deltaproteobacteria bacterium]